MNVFVLNTGRCASSTFIKACEHINNYSCGHETLADRLGLQRTAYPENHIEADNRLSWFLGRLDEQYGNNAFYIHLTRNIDDTAASFVKRMDMNYGIMKAYKQGILMNESAPSNKEALTKDYLHTVNSNIKHFLKDKTNTMQFKLENAQKDFEVFFERINAEGDLSLALKEWNTTHNAS